MIKSSKKAATSQGEVSAEKFRETLEKDLVSLTGLLHFIQKHPAIIDLMAEYAYGELQNFLNKNKNETPQ